MTCCTTWPTRFSSSNPFSKQLRNICLASRRACFEIFICSGGHRPPESCCSHATVNDRRRSSRRQLAVGFFGQPPLVFDSQNLAGDFGGGLHDQAADFP